MSDPIPTPPPEATQTAGQINLPQTGAATVSPPTKPPAFTPGPSTASPASAASPAAVVDSATQVTRAPRPVPLISKTIPPVTAALKTQPGWWKVGAIKGVKADVSKAVQNISGIPAHWQAALLAEIAAHDAPAVVVSAHFMQENRKTFGPAGVVTTKGKLVLHLDISPLDGFVS